MIAMPKCLLWYLVISLSAISSVLAVEIGAIEQSWVNEHYTRTVDVAKSYIKETVIVEAKNIDANPNGHYYFTLPDGIGSIANVSVISMVINDQAVLIQLEQISHDLYKVKLPIPLGTGSSISLKIRYVYLDNLLAIPEKLELDQVQSLLMKLNKFNYNPYVTNDYTLVFTGLTKGKEMDLVTEKLPEVANVDNLPELKSNVDENDKVLKFGPVSDIPPYSIKEMGLLYDHNKPLGKVENLERSIWLPSSDINQLQIEEYYELTNTGAKLNSGFSRVDWLKGKYETTRFHWGLSHLEFPTSENLQFDDYYFTDKVGMVTNHKLIKKFLVFQPRFPLFGDWNYNFTMGWNQKFDNILKKLDSETYMLKIPLLNTAMDISYENVNLNIYLPENSEFLNISSPIKFNSIVEDYEKSYLDVSDGHKKITINYSNLFDDLSKIDIFVMYKFTKVNYWFKIIKISGFVFVGLISYYLLNLINISI